MKPELVAQFGTQARERFSACRGAHLAFRRKRSVSQWAQEERWIGHGASPLSQLGAIRYDYRKMPWCREPMDSAADRDVQVTILWWASGMAKTETVVNIIGHSISEEPKNIFVAYPKDDSRDKFSRDVLQRSLIDPTPCVRDVVVEAKSRDSGNTIQYKRFAGGSIYMVGAGSESNFRGPRAGLIYCDEIDGMPTGGEGDRILLAFKRAEGFANAIKLLSGTGTFKATMDKDGKKIYRSNIEKWFDLSDQRKWFCPCRVCGEGQWLKFEQITHPKGRPDQAVYLCEKCDAPHEDRQRIAMVMAGAWQATAPFTGVRGYWLNGVNATLPAEKGFSTKLHQMVIDAETAKQGGKESERVWINTFKAELATTEEETEAPPEWNALFLRRENYGTDTKIVIPNRCLLLTASVDMQQNRLEVEWEGWGRNEENWGVKHVTIWGNTQDQKVWRQLETELRTRFTREDGKKLALSLAFVDSGKWADWVLWFLSHLKTTGSEIARKCRAIRGSAQYPHPIIDLRFTKLSSNTKWQTVTGSTLLMGHWIGGDAAKDAIYDRLRRVSDGETIPDGYIHFPVSYGQEYFRQLTSERVFVEYIRGKEVRRYKNPSKQRNETLDLRVYNFAAFKLLQFRKINFDELEVELANQDSPRKATEQPKQRRPNRIREILGGGW